MGGRISFRITVNAIMTVPSARTLVSDEILLTFTSLRQYYLDQVQRVDGAFSHPLSRVEPGSPLEGLCAFHAYKNNGIIADKQTKEKRQLRNHRILRYPILIVYATMAKDRKVRFKETGRVPKEIFKDGKYIDHIIMTLEL
jgi:hypothetical protein